MSAMVPVRSGLSLFRFLLGRTSQGPEHEWSNGYAVHSLARVTFLLLAVFIVAQITPHCNHA
jgi:hypothetical protein